MGGAAEAVGGAAEAVGGAAEVVNGAAELMNGGADVEDVDAPPPPTTPAGALAEALPSPPKPQESNSSPPTSAPTPQRHTPKRTPARRRAGGARVRAPLASCGAPGRTLPSGPLPTLAQLSQEVIFPEYEKRCAPPVRPKPKPRRARLSPEEHKARQAAALDAIGTSSHTLVCPVTLAMFRTCHAWRFHTCHTSHSSPMTTAISCFQ